MAVKTVATHIEFELRFQYSLLSTHGQSNACVFISPSLSLSLDKNSKHTLNANMNYADSVCNCTDNTISTEDELT